MNHESKVSRQVSKFVQLYSKIWWDTKSDFQELPEETSYWYKRPASKSQ